MKIFYKKGYKYQLVKDCSSIISIKPNFLINSEFITLCYSGKLIIRNGYAWDGPSGPSIHTKSFTRGSLVHDALYQLMREKKLPQRYRKTADQILKKICKEDGMSSIRSWWVYVAVRLCGGSSADPENKKAILKAPK